MQQDQEWLSQFQNLGEVTMKFERIIGASADGKDTHKCLYYIKGFGEMVGSWYKSKVDRSWPGLVPQIVDPFARNCEWARQWTNDIDVNTKAKFHMDALEFLKSMEKNYFDCVLFDPPFSPVQAERTYESGHVNVYTDPKYVKDCWKEIARITRPGGKVLKLGYNSSRHSTVFDLDKGWIVNFGANRNDVVMTLWTKRQTTIDSVYWLSEQEKEGMR
jgi:hypothetical protein